jgi:glycosyltransferase involved in cell wall biosynthesis
MAVAKSMKQSYGIPAQEIKIVYNAISSHAGDTAHSRIEIRKELQLPVDQKIVLMVARQTAVKNYPMFIRTARRVCAQRPDVTFVSVGRGDMMEELNALVAQIGVTGRVIFVGQRYDVQRWLAAADIFCFTSNSEGFPNAILEAMIAGLPVVTTNYPAVKELITHDHAGVIVPLNDDKRMAEEILHLLDNPALAHQIAGAAQLMIGKQFTWGPLINEMESLYLSLMEKVG